MKLAEVLSGEQKLALAGTALRLPAAQATPACFSGLPPNRVGDKQ